MLEFLDEFEDAPRYYKRKIEKVQLIGDFSQDFQGGEVLPCYCYQLDNFKNEILAKSFLKVYSSKEKAGTKLLTLTQLSSIELTHTHSYSLVLTRTHSYSLILTHTHS